jgi:hypothetical protein
MNRKHRQDREVLPVFFFCVVFDRNCELQAASEFQELAWTASSCFRRASSASTKSL